MNPADIDAELAELRKWVDRRMSNGDVNNLEWLAAAHKLFAAIERLQRELAEARIAVHAAMRLLTPQQCALLTDREEEAFGLVESVVVEPPAPEEQR